MFLVRQHVQFRQAAFISLQLHVIIYFTIYQLLTLSFAGLVQDLSPCPTASDAQVPGFDQGKLEGRGQADHARAGQDLAGCGG